MSYKGGYQIIDLKKKALSGTEVVIPGIYESIEGTGKAVLLHDLVIGETELHDTFAEFSVSESDFVCAVYGYNITVNDDDEVTAEAAAGEHIADADTGTEVTTINAILDLLEAVGIMAPAAE